MRGTCWKSEAGAVWEEPECHEGWNCRGRVSLTRDSTQEELQPSQEVPPTAEGGEKKMPGLLPSLHLPISHQCLLLAQSAEPR